LKGSLWNQKWFLKAFVEDSLDTFIGSLKNYLRKWFFKEPWFKGGTRNGALKNNFLMVSLRHLYRFFEDLFKEMEPWFERFFVEPEMVP